MAVEKLFNETEKVNTHIATLDIEIRDTVESIRQIILSTDETIGERIKWNNPSFFYRGPMKPFDPKEYKREIAVFNLHKNRIMLVFPGGDKLDDGSGFFQGDYADGRRLLVFKDGKEVAEKEMLLKKAIKNWLQLVEK